MVTINTAAKDSLRLTEKREGEIEREKQSDRAREGWERMHRGRDRATEYERQDSDRQRDRQKDIAKQRAYRLNPHTSTQSVFPFHDNCSRKIFEVIVCVFFQIWAP